MKPIVLDGASLTRDKLVEIAFGASVASNWTRAR